MKHYYKWGGEGAESPEELDWDVHTEQDFYSQMFTRFSTNSPTK